MGDGASGIQARRLAVLLGDENPVREDRIVVEHPEVDQQPERIADHVRGIREDGLLGWIHQPGGWAFKYNMDKEYIEYIKSLKTVKISMDGKGRATDNAYIERFFRTIKHDKIYLHLPENGQELFVLCSEFITFYNTKRSHSQIGKVPPVKRYLPTT